MKRRLLLALLFAVVISLLLNGCNLFGWGGKEKEQESSGESELSEEEPDPEYPVEAGGITLPARPGNVVSLAPAITEKLHDLGMADRLTGVSDFCDYPQEIDALPDCGTAQLPNIEEIIALEPHLILAESPIVDADALSALEEAGIPVAVLPRDRSIDSLLQCYTDLARLMEGEVSGAAMGAAFGREYRGRLDALNDALERYTQTNGRKTALYLRLINTPAGGGSFFTVATGDTLEQELLSAICLDNIAQAQTGWVYTESAAKAEGAADFAALDIIFMDENFVTIKDLEQSAFFKGLPATIKDRYLYVSSIIFERQSLRTLSMLEEMAKYAYPDADIKAIGTVEPDQTPDSGDGEEPAE